MAVSYTIFIYSVVLKAVQGFNSDLINIVILVFANNDKRLAVSDIYFRPSVLNCLKSALTKLEKCSRSIEILLWKRHDIKA